MTNLSKKGCICPDKTDFAGVPLIDYGCPVHGDAPEPVSQSKKCSEDCSFGAVFVHHDNGCPLETAPPTGEKEGWEGRIVEILSDYKLGRIGTWNEANGIVIGLVREIEQEAIQRGRDEVLSLISRAKDSIPHEDHPLSRLGHKLLAEILKEARTPKNGKED